MATSSTEDRFNRTMALDGLEVQHAQRWRIGQFGSMERRYFIFRVKGGKQERLTDNSGDVIYYTLEEAQDALLTLPAPDHV